MTNKRPHSLYRFFDDKDQLLYIGITFDLPARLDAHCGDKLWWTDVTRVTVEPHTDRAAALNAERDAIRAEHPIHNLMHNGRTITRLKTRTNTGDTYPALIRTHNHSKLTPIEGYAELRAAIDDFARNTDGAITLTMFLNSLRDMALTSIYADCCRDTGDIGCGEIRFPHRVEREGDWINCDYHCPTCDRIWTCGWSCNAAVWAAGLFS